MAQENKIEVINRMGWRKEFVLEKSIIQIGRDARNDVILDDGLENDVAPRHAQLLPSSANRNGMRLINLSSSSITVIKQGGASNGGTTLEPRSSTEIVSGDQAKVGSFTLVFNSGDSRSEVVRLAVDMPDAMLTLDQPLRGALKIQHVGDKAAVQFRVELQGLESQFVELGPGPVLFPNAEKQIEFRIRHPRRATPVAGPFQITFVVTAPDAYPGEQATISQTIQVAPFFQHRMRVVVVDDANLRLG
ncbi:MAG: FHA domain-containing protein [Litorilinea sp.]